MIPPASGSSGGSGSISFLSNTLQSTTAELNQCKDKNRKLTQLNLELTQLNNKLQQSVLSAQNESERVKEELRVCQTDLTSYKNIHKQLEEAVLMQQQGGGGGSQPGQQVGGGSPESSRPGTGSSVESTPEHELRWGQEYKADQTKYRTPAPGKKSSQSAPPPPAASIIPETTGKLITIYQVRARNIVQLIYIGAYCVCFHL